MSGIQNVVDLSGSTDEFAYLQMYQKLYHTHHMESFEHQCEQLRVPEEHGHCEMLSHRSDMSISAQPIK